MSRILVAALTNLSERMTASMGKYQGGRAASLLSNQRRLLNAMDGITSMRENHNSLETPSAHTLKLTKAASKLAQESAKIKANVFKDYLQYSTELDAAIAERAGIKENRFASEIRTAFREVPIEDRLNYINEIIQRKDGASFAAIVDAPQILTGIDPDTSRKLTESFYLNAAPDLWQEQQDLKDAMDTMTASLDVINAGVNEYSDPVALHKIEQEVQLSHAAADKFNAALTE